MIVGLLFWLVMAAPIPAIEFLAFQTVKSWNLPRQTVWALALTGLSAGYTVVLYCVAFLASLGLISAAFLLKDGAGGRQVLGTAVDVLWFGCLLFACVSVVAFVLFLYSVIGGAWRMRRGPYAQR